MSHGTKIDLRTDFKAAAPRSLYFAIFAVSGFSGLIYESIWSHYLKLFLGHAAYAQSLVLMLFMGGMAVGSWLASRFSADIRLPILAYAVVELIIGVAALLFHGVFTGVIEVFYSSVLPSVGSPWFGALLKWLTATLLVLPQAVLLGMTFPILSAGILRRYPDSPGGSIAMLYFTNSIGAAIGVLASGFWMIGKVGLPGTIMTAGIINIALAVAVWVMVRLDPAAESEPLPQTRDTGDRRTVAKLFMVAAFITGAASFIYEIGWIRMLSLVLGSTTHSFELMLSAFITGLAFGGLWIKRRIDRIDNPVRFSGYVQIAMGTLAVLTIPVYMESFGWMEWLLAVLQRNTAGYTAFTLASHLIALAVMLPATFLAGMTLPLFTYVLLRRGTGEASIGRIYAANTVGAIAGVLFAVHIGLPWLGLKSLIIVGAMLDLGLGFVLLRNASVKAEGLGGHPVAVAVSIAVLAVVVVAVDLDRGVLTSGVYRVGKADASANQEILFYRDGKTATVSLMQGLNGIVSLSTNGKPDAAIQPDLSLPATTDEITMTLAGTIPFGYMPHARRIANIGLGSGQTTHVLLGNPRVEVVDTVEIEREMAYAARGFGAAVERAFNDPRSRIHIEDAKTFFSLQNSVYDVIIAEPSNPWVSGVASLFSDEFYGTVKRYLEPDGLFVQWIQLYEFSDELSASILKAVSNNFGDYAIYLTDSVNMLVVARNQGSLGDPNWRLLWEGELQASLQRVGVHSAVDLDARRVVGRDAMVPYLVQSRSPMNSDYFPYVDLNAGEARFRASMAGNILAWLDSPLPVLEMVGSNSIDFSLLTPSEHLLRARSASLAYSIYDRLMSPEGERNATASADSFRVAMMTDWLNKSDTVCPEGADVELWNDTVHRLARESLPFLSGRDAVTLIDAVFDSDCGGLRSETAQSWYGVYRSIAMRDADSMADSASRLLAASADLSVAEKGYLIGAAMLGEIASGRADAAYPIWERYSRGVYDAGNVPDHMNLLRRIAASSAGQKGLTAQR